jgi:4-amino-4-deoxy-L-arabinose transferase-like glycosyltransferase
MSSSGRDASSPVPAPAPREAALGDAAGGPSRGIAGDRWRRGLAVLFLAGLVARLAFLVLEPATRPLGDERTWLAAGLDWVAASFHPLRSEVLFHPPLHPYLIAAVYTLWGSLGAVKLAQVVLGALLVPVVGLLGKRTFGPRAGLTAAAFAAFYPDLVWYSVHFWSEPLFLFLLWWGLERALAADDSRRVAAASGVLLGMAALTREPALYFSPFVAAWLLVGRGRGGVGRALVFVAAMTAVVAPWTLRNWVRFGAFVPVSTMGGRALWEGNTEGSRNQVYAEWDATGRDEGPVAQYHLAVRQGLRAIRERQPTWFFEKLVREVPGLFSPDNMVLVHAKRRGYGPPRPLVMWMVAAITVAPYLAVMGLFIVGLARLTWSRPAALLVLFLGFYVLLHVVVLGHHRFRLPILPVIFVIAAGLPGAPAAMAPLTPWRRALLVVLAVVFALCVLDGFLGFLQEPAFVGASANHP